MTSEKQRGKQTIEVFIEVVVLSPHGEEHEIWVRKIAVGGRKLVCNLGANSVFY
jgi:hypothetical protein